MAGQRGATGYASEPPSQKSFCIVDDDQRPHTFNYTFATARFAYRRGTDRVHDATIANMTSWSGSHPTGGIDHAGDVVSDNRPVTEVSRALVRAPALHPGQRAVDLL